MNNKQRFRKAFAYGLACAFACAIVCTYITELTAELFHITFPVLYLASGYLIAKAIQKAGGGIGVKYAYLGGGLTLFSIILSEMFAFGGYDIIVHPQLWGTTVQIMIQTWFSFQGSSILTLFFMIWGIYVGYSEADISNH